jgi:hypothetical protein
MFENLMALPPLDMVAIVALTATVLALVFVRVVRALDAIL